MAYDLKVKVALKPILTVKDMQRGKGQRKGWSQNVL